MSFVLHCRLASISCHCSGNSYRSTALLPSCGRQFSGHWLRT
ncbi:hypothetical protein DsansV1_C21g0168171 [Dioscorea sansibarensis]